MLKRIVKLAPSRLRERDCDGLLPLHVACKEGWGLEKITVLFYAEKDAILEKTTGTNQTPLDLARENDSDATTMQYLSKYETAHRSTQNRIAKHQAGGPSKKARVDSPTNK